MATFLQQVVNGLSLGSVYALIAVGYSLVYSILLFSNFAHGGFLVVGGYAAYGMLNAMGMNVWAAGAGAILAAGVVAIVTERMAYRPIRERTSATLYLLIASMGVSIVIENIFVVTIGGRYRALPEVFPAQPIVLAARAVGEAGEAALRFFPGAAEGLTPLLTISAFDLVSLGVTVVFLLLLQMFLMRTRWGLAIRAAACDLRTAGLMGVNVNLLIAIVFFVAGALAAVGGIFLATRYTLYPQLGNMITTKAFVAAVIGGLGSLLGAVIGGILLGLAEMLTAGFISSQMRDFVVFALLIATLIIKPSGLFGRDIRDKV